MSLPEPPYVVANWAVTLRCHRKFESGRALLEFLGFGRELRGRGVDLDALTLQEAVDIADNMLIGNADAEELLTERGDEFAVDAECDVDQLDLFIITEEGRT